MYIHITCSSLFLLYANTTFYHVVCNATTERLQGYTYNMCISMYIYDMKQIMVMNAMTNR